jgi:hypothetical protein
MLALLAFTPDCNRIASVEATSFRGVCGTPRANACTLRVWPHVTIHANCAIGSTLRALNCPAQAKQSSMHATLAQHVLAQHVLAQHVLAQHVPHRKPAHCSALQP